ncbi:hypothetical protein POM88_046191 [Heracleum sosnowskyi]|uniref:Glycine-rich protein n=1 Tax=Heracleum sosnowskyi TaxID=360622 RepID=A0AAD8H5U3_9APIA|nr:hypothetical protein POM88_046191 [Heracleum sosnowskyi]
MKRVNIVYCFSILLIILLSNGSFSASVQKDEALATDATKENTVNKIQDSKVFEFPGGRGFPWGGYGNGRAFPWLGPGGHQGDGGSGWYPFGGWFPWGGPGFNNGGGSRGGGEVGNHAGGTPGTPGGWVPWGGRGGDGGSGGSPGSPGGPNCGGNGGGPGGGAGGCGGNGGGAGGGRGGGWLPPHTTMPNPSNTPGCGNMQIIPSASGYTISYDCGNCKYQYTVDYNGVTTGGSGNCS